jgi:hypothetical protein
MILRLLLTALIALPVAAQQPSANQGPAPQPGQHERGDSQRREFRGVFGTVTEISGSTVKIQQTNGTVVTVTTSGNTQFRKERQPIKLSDIKVGDNLGVRGTANGENAWTAEVVSVVPSREQMQSRFKESLGKTMVIGDVKSIDAPKLTIQRVDGVEQSIEADENTSFRKGREGSITLPDIHVGDTVMARGELKNGVFVPTAINVVDPEMARRIKERGDVGFMGGGFGSAGGGSDMRRSNETGSSGPPAASSPNTQPPPKQ